MNIDLSLLMANYGFGFAIVSLLYRFLLHRNYKNSNCSAWDLILNHSDVDGFDINQA
jgi:hypothetical protein